MNFNRQDIKSWTVIYLNALPTCLEMDNCKDCLTKLKDFDCKWCSALNQCSTGTFRSRQDWLLKGCDVRKIKEVDNCPLPITYKEEPVEEFNHVLRMHPEETVTVSEMNVEQGRHESSPLERCKTNSLSKWRNVKFISSSLPCTNATSLALIRFSIISSWMFIVSKDIDDFIKFLINY